MPIGRGDPGAAGTIAGRTVGCLSARQQLALHEGYEHRPADRHDVAILHKLAKAARR